jgi:CDP-4-dehydro-6-deoxyglucose reductase
VAGEVTYGATPQSHYISAEERAKGFALLCQAKPASDLLIEADEIVGMEDLMPRVLPCRIFEMTRLAPDVMGVKLRLPMNDNVRYFPGQNLSFILEGGVRREYSIANACTAEGVTAVELHIRHYPGGVFTDRLFGDIEVGKLMRIELPLGTFFLRTDTESPLILMATGTGFAPIKAMMEHAIDTGLIHKRSIALYWGGRRRSDLYFYELAESWARAYPRFHFAPIVSRPGECADWTGRTGYVQDNVLADQPDLSGFDVYACGSPAMVKDARARFAALGTGAPVRFFADEFLTAADKAADEQNIDS